MGGGGRDENGAPGDGSAGVVREVAEDRRTISGRNSRSIESEVGEERLRVEEDFQWAG